MSKWTVMVYLAGDNNLTAEMAATLQQIKTVTGENPAIDLYVYFDGISRNVPTLYCDFSSSNSDIEFFRSIGIKNKLIQRESDYEPEPNENSASMYNILNFVHWCVEKDKNYVAENGEVVDQRPNKKYALIFSGHSFGFQDWGLLKDDSANYYMTLSKLRWLFEWMTFDKEKLGKAPWNAWRGRDDEARTTEVIGKKLDLLGFDSCEMSSLEIAHQFHGLAETMVASEGTVPNSGWNYADIFLETLKDELSAASRQVAITFVREFIMRQNRLALADGSTDMAAWDLENLPGLETAFGGFAESLLKCFSDSETVAYHQMRRILTYVHWQCQTYSYEQNVDLGDLCHLLAKEIDQVGSEISASEFGPIKDVRDACNSVIDARRKCVLLTGYSGSDFQFSKGVSVFFPWSLASYEAAEADYKKLHFVSKTDSGIKWNQFLEKYLGEVSLRPANEITPVGLDGALKRSGDSVVYESYTLLDERGPGLSPAVVPSPDTTKRPPDTGKRPPDTGKRPPDTGKRPPDTGRGANMSVFLSRFMKLKNFEPRWNRTGFTSAVVRFENSRGPRTARDERSLGVVTIPGATGIEKILDQLTYRITAIEEDGGSTLRQYLDILRRISEESPESTKVEVFSRLKDSPLLGQEFWEDTAAKNAFAEILSGSISAISDEPVRLELSNKINAINGFK